MTRDEFIQVMGDLMILAFRTDLTRVATIMSSPERWGSPLKVQGLFDKPVDHLTAMPVLVDYMRTLGDDLVIVSPDTKSIEVERT